MRRLYALIVCLATVPAYGQANCQNGQCFAPPPRATQVIDSTGFDLAAGERLVAVDGKPVGGAGVMPVADAGLLPGEINRDAQAYAWAKREAAILASRGTAGHPMGCAPGTRYSGTGYSHSGRPVHCYSEMPESVSSLGRACGDGTGRFTGRAIYVDPLHSRWFIEPVAGVCLWRAFFVESGQLGDGWFCHAPQRSTGRHPNAKSSNENLRTSRRRPSPARTVPRRC